VACLTGAIASDIEVVAVKLPPLLALRAFEAVSRHQSVCRAAEELCVDHTVVSRHGYTDGLAPGLQRTVVPVYSAIAATVPLPASVATSILPDGAVLCEVGAIARMSGTIWGDFTSVQVGSSP
jgi:hypothetical protein